MELIDDIRYPEFGTYKGPATEFNTEWNSVLDLFIDTHKITSDIILKTATTFSNVKPLQILVWKQKETWLGIPYWHYKMRISAYQVGIGQVSAAIAPAIAAAILGIIQIAIIAIAAFIILNTAKEIIWGPEGSLPIIPIAILIGVAVFAYTVLRKPEIIKKI